MGLPFIALVYPSNLTAVCSTAGNVSTLGVEATGSTPVILNLSAALVGTPTADPLSLWQATSMPLTAGQLYLQLFNLMTLY